MTIQEFNNRLDERSLNESTLKDSVQLAVQKFIKKNGGEERAKKAAQLIINSNKLYKKILPMLQKLFASGITESSDYLIENKFTDFVSKYGQAVPKVLVMGVILGSISISSLFAAGGISQETKDALANIEAMRTAQRTEQQQDVATKGGVTTTVSSNWNASNFQKALIYAMKEQGADMNTMKAAWNKVYVNDKIVKAEAESFFESYPEAKSYYEFKQSQS